MKKYIFGLMSVVALFSLASCSDDDFETHGVQSGSLINFSIDPLSTRTVYESDNKFQIDWQTGDKITILCEQAEGKKRADYTITPTNADHKTSVSESKYGIVSPNESGLCWNGAIKNGNNIHNFYAAYPAGSVIESPRYQEGELDFQMPNNQTGTVSGPLSTELNHQYVASPDMQHAYMAASAEGIDANTIYSEKTPDKKGTINLLFAPVMTTLDVVVNYGDPNDNTTWPDLNVTGITVTLPGVSRFSGNTFRYDAAKKEIVTTENKSTETFLCEVRYGDYNTIALKKEQSIKFTIFLPPVEISSANSIKIDVNAVGAVNHKATVSASIAPSSRRTVNLPSITHSTEVTPNNWMSKLDGHIYLNQLSIPGSTASAQYQSWQDYAVIQSKTLTEQWNDGVRAFDIKTGLAANSSIVSYGRDKVVCYENGVNSQKLFVDAMNEIAGLVEGTDEVAVVLLSFQYDGLGWLSVRQSKANWAARIDELVKSYIDNESVKPFEPNLTLGECRGKIILINRDKYGSNQDNYYGGYIDGSDAVSADFFTSGEEFTLRSSTSSSTGTLFLQNWTRGDKNTFYATKYSYIEDCDEKAMTEIAKSSTYWVINDLAGVIPEDHGLINKYNNTADYMESAAYMNPRFLQRILNSSRGSGSTGIVLVVHQGVDKATQGSNTYQIMSATLPQAIINNNFKHRMLRDNDEETGNQTGNH